MKPKYKEFLDTFIPFLDSRLDKTRFKYKYYNVNTWHNIKV